MRSSLQHTRLPFSCHSAHEPGHQTSSLQLDCCRPCTLFIPTGLQPAALIRWADCSSACMQRRQQYGEREACRTVDGQGHAPGGDLHTAALWTLSGMIWFIAQHTRWRVELAFCALTCSVYSGNLTSLMPASALPTAQQLARHACRSDLSLLIRPPGAPRARRARRACGSARPTRSRPAAPAWRRPPQAAPRCSAGSPPTGAAS